MAPGLVYHSQPTWQVGPRLDPSRSSRTTTLGMVSRLKTCSGAEGMVKWKKKLAAQEWASKFGLPSTHAKLGVAV